MFRRGLPLLCALLFLIACVSARISAAEPTDEALMNIRAALAGRDLPGAQAALAAAAKIQGDEKYDAARVRLEELADYVGQFWAAYDKSLATLASVEELAIGDTFIAIVEVGPDKLIIRAAGTNRTYTKRTVPAGIALVIAERVIKPNVPQNKVIIGSFAALDAKGDLAKARKYWQEAQAAGVDIKRLLPELDAPRALPPIQIPDLSSQQKLMLDPKNWQQRSAGARGFVKANLTIGAQNDAGRLVVKVPTDLEQVQVVTKRPIAGNFAFRVTLEKVQAGQQFGLFAADAKEDAVVVDLPEGTFMVEFYREGAAYKAKVAGSEVEVKTIGKPPARFAGTLGISAQAGQEFTISAIEVGGQ